MYCNSISETLISLKDGFICLSDIEGRMILAPNKYTLLPIRKNEGGIPMLSFPICLHEGVMPVALKNGKCGYIDAEGNEMLPCVYEDAAPFFEGRAAVKKDGKWGMIDRLGKVKVPFAYDAIFYDGTQIKKDGLICVAVNGKFGYVTEDGVIAIAPVFDSHVGKTEGDFREGVAPVVYKGEKFYIDRNGNKVITPAEQFDFIASFDEGKAQVIRFNGKQSSLLGYIDKSGKIAVPLQYRQTGCRLSEGAFAVAIGSNIVFIDNTGKILLETPYDAVTEFSGGIAWGKKDGVWDCFDRTGKVISNGVDVDNIISCGNAEWVAEVGGKYARVKTNGKTLTEFKVIPPCPYLNVSEDEWILHCLS